MPRASFASGLLKVPDRNAGSRGLRIRIGIIDPTPPSCNRNAEKIQASVILTINPDTIAAAS
jgi:hypothetical protein